MSAHTTVNRPVRTSTAVIARPIVEASLDAVLDPSTHNEEVDRLVDEDTLVEEVSIDGMCGVY